MVEEAKKAAAPAPAKGAENAEPSAKGKKKKSRPTNCAQSNKRIRRKDWYYRDGKYFANKQCYHLMVAQEKAKKEKESPAAAPGAG